MACPSPRNGASLGCEGERFGQLVEPLCHKTGGFKFDSWYGTLIISSDVCLESSQPLAEISIFWSKVRQERGAVRCALPVVPNVKLGMEAKNFFLDLILHDLLRETFTFITFMSS